MTIEIDSREFIIDHLRKHDATNFKIPNIQRTYSWEKNSQIYDFIDDLVTTTYDPDGASINSAHYFGAFCTTKSKDENTELIIDGQQRITTSLLFLKYAEDKVKDHNNRNDIKMIITRNKLELGKNDNNIFQEIIKGKKPNSESLLVKAYESFGDLIKEIEKERSNLTPISIDSLVRTLLDNFKMIKIKLPNNLLGYSFHFINNRGKELKQNELIKSHLFIQLEANLDLSNTSDEIDTYAEKWTKMRINIEKLVDIEIFIQHYLALKLDKPTRIKKLYDDFKNFQRTKNELTNASVNPVTRRLDDIFEWSEYYLTLLNSNDALDKLTVGRLPAGVWLKRIRDLGAYNVYPILLAGYKKYYLGGRQKDFCKLVDSCYRLHLRVKSLGKIKTDGYKVKMETIAQDMITNNRDCRQVIKNLHKYVENKYNNNEIKDVGTALKNISGKIAKHCLLLIEEHKYGVEKIANLATVEHILPKNIEGPWKKYIQENYDETGQEFIKEYLNNLGNMTLLSSRKNAKVSNKLFNEKIYKYHSEYKITQELKEWLEKRNTWMPGDIEDRHDTYAESLKDALDISKHPIKK